MSRGEILTREKSTLDAQRSRRRWRVWGTTPLLVLENEDIGVQTSHSVTVTHSKLRELSNLFIPLVFIQEAFSASLKRGSKHFSLGRRSYSQPQTPLLQVNCPS